MFSFKNTCLLGIGEYHQCVGIAWSGTSNHEHESLYITNEELARIATLFHSCAVHIISKRLVVNHIKLVDFNKS